MRLSRAIYIAVLAWLLSLVVLPLLINLATERVPPWLTPLSRNPWPALLVTIVVLGVLTAASRPGRQPRLPGYERRYRTWVSERHETVDTKGLGPIGPFAPRLDDVFVDLALTSSAPGQVPTGLLGTFDGSRRRSIWHFLDQDGRTVLVVLGGPGSGKTTLLGHVARHLAANRGRLPILLSLRNHAEVMAGSPALDLVEVVRRTLPAGLSAEPPSFWESRLQDGSCVVLLDGLDEVAGADERRAVVSWVDDQVAAHPANDFVITSRPTGYRDAFVAAASATVQIMPLRPKQIEQFLYGLYRAAARQAGRDEERARASADDLLAKLARVPGLHDLTVNPLLLTMIANVHRYGNGQLPESRAALYQEVCAVALFKRDESKNLAVRPAGPQRLDLVGHLAYEWMRSGVRSLDERETLATLREWIDEAADFLRVAEASGLLVRSSWQEVSFAHQTFQEYLAGQYIRDHDLIGELAATVDDPWWRETTLLYAAVNPADSIVLAAIDSGSPPALSLAFEVAESGGRISPPVRGQLEALLRSVLGPGADPKIRRTCAGVLLARLLQPMTGTPGGDRISQNPVTTGLYEIFRAETGTPAPDEPPDGSLSAVARGMWSADVERFFEWLNEVGPECGSAYRFRPLSFSNMETLAHNGPIWYRSGREWQVSRQPDTVDRADLIEAVATDLRGTLLLSAFLHILSDRACDRVNSATAELSRLFKQRTAGQMPTSARRSIVAQMADKAETLLNELGSLLTVLRDADRWDTAAAERIGRALGRAGVRGPEAADAMADTAPDEAQRLMRNLTLVEREVSNGYQLLERTLGPTAEPTSPVDRILNQLGRIPGTYIDIPKGGGNAAAAVARALIDDGWAEGIPWKEQSTTFHQKKVDTVTLNSTAKRRSKMIAEVRQLKGDSNPGIQLVTNDLDALTDPIFDRRRSITAGDASTVRLLALVLAAVAKKRGRSELCGQLVELAAAARLIERRQTGKSPLEAIFLVYS